MISVVRLHKQTPNSAIKITRQSQAATRGESPAVYSMDKVIGRESLEESEASKHGISVPFNPLREWDEYLIAFCMLQIASRKSAIFMGNWRKLSEELLRVPHEY